MHVHSVRLHARQCLYQSVVPTCYLCFELHCRATVCAWYPITPSSSVAEAFEKYCQKFRVDAATGTHHYAIVQAEDEIMLITDTGVLVRTRVAEIREMGRATQGVTLIGLDEGAKLSGLQRIVENDAENGVDNEGETGDASEGDDTNNGTPTDGVA